MGAGVNVGEGVSVTVGVGGIRVGTGVEVGGMAVAVLVGSGVISSMIGGWSSNTDTAKPTEARASPLLALICN